MLYHIQPHLLNLPGTRWPHHYCETTVTVPQFVTLKLIANSCERLNFLDKPEKFTKRERFID